MLVFDCGSITAMQLFFENSGNRTDELESSKPGNQIPMAKGSYES